MDAVTDVLVARMRPGSGLSRMAAISLALHVVVAAAILVMPGIGVSRQEPQTVMQISLGGAPGPQAGGMTPMGGRAVQAPEAREPLKREPIRPPAAKAPEMTLPTPRAKPAPRKPAVREAPPDARSTTPARGAQPSPGNTVAPTGATGLGFGLTTGGGGTGGYLDVGNFCCPEYLATMQQLIQRNWNGRQQVSGQTQVRFTVQRDGRLTDIQVEKPSGYFALDQTAERALLLTRQIPPLPPQYTENQLTVHLIFNYQR